MYYSLFLDTTSNKINLAIIDNHRNVIDVFTHVTNHNMIEHIIDDINNLLIKNKTNIENIKKIYCVDMFGLFTGIRTCSLILKAWSTFNKKIKIYHINTLAFNANGKCISLMDAKSNKYYCAIYNNKRTVKKPFLIDDNELGNLKIKYQKYKIIMSQEINMNNLANKLKFFKKTNIKKYHINYLKDPC